MAGLIRVLRQPTLRGLAVCYGLYQVTWGVLIVAVPLLAARGFVTGPTNMGARDVVAGVLWAAAGVAGAAGALAAGQFRAQARERRIMALGMIVTTIAVWPISAMFGLAGVALGLMLVALVAGPIDVSLLTLRQRRTDPRELGRVLSVSMSLNLAGIPVGSALAGMLLTWSVPGTLAVAALASLLAAASVRFVPAQD
jgi:predicted MFS family arabinose efflux permease